MWLYVLYDNQMKTNCNSRSKKNCMHRTDSHRMWADLKAYQCNSPKNYFDNWWGALNSEHSCIYSSPSFKLQTGSGFSDFYLVHDHLNGLSVIFVVKALFREQKIYHNFHDAVIDISAPRRTGGLNWTTSKYNAIYYYYFILLLLLVLWCDSSEEPRPTEAVAARWQCRGPCGYPSTLIPVFLTGFLFFSHQAATQLSSWGWVYPGPDPVLSEKISRV